MQYNVLYSVCGQHSFLSAASDC